MAGQLVDPDTLEARSLRGARELQRVIESGDSDVQRALGAGAVLVTGGSGFIGKQLVEKLLRACPDVPTIFLLVRPRRGVAAPERVRQQLQEPVYDAVRRAQPGFEARVVGVAGDVALPALGLSDQDRRRLLDEVEVIFHVAATVRFNEPLKQAVLTNVRGARDVLALGASCRRLRALVHVSTMYVQCHRDACPESVLPAAVAPDALIQLAETMDEARLDAITPQLLPPWPNTYTFTKALAESVVARAATTLRARVAIVRPAIVVCAHREPELGWVDPRNVFGPSGLVLGMLLGASHVGYAAEDCEMDYVPVDLVNNLIITAAATAAAAYPPDRALTPVAAPDCALAAQGAGLVVYNYAATKNRRTWEQMLQVFSTYGRQLVSPRTLWYCYGLTTQHRWLYDLLTLNHRVMGLMADAVLLVMGKKPIATKLYSKMYSELLVFHYFLSHTWQNHQPNTERLFAGLGDEDRRLFNFDISSVDYEELMQLWVLGLRKQVLKDGLKGTRQAIRRQLWFRLAHYAYVALVALLLYLLLKLVFSVGALALSLAP